MTTYRASINGFWCHNETWDDVFNWDGKHDEVYLSVNTKVVDAAGAVLDDLNSESETMGDTWRLPGRVQAGSASALGGIVSGDKFPWDQPMIRQGGVNTTVRVPPYVIWEGEPAPGQMVLLTATIWEWDPGSGAWDGWLEWQKQTDAVYGQRAKEIFGGIWPVAKPVFDAVSLGIQTFATLAGLWSPLGQSMRRPIGLQRDPANPDGSLFNPVTFALSTETLPYLVGSNPQGLGQGIREIVYKDDPYLRGVYSVYVQIEAVGAGGSGVVPVQQNWRWCNKCHGLFFGGGVATSQCPTGGTHTDPAISRSGNYSLPHNVPPDVTRQSGWAWCGRCQGLYFGPGHGSSRCPAGGTHEVPALSGNYSLRHNQPPQPGYQDNWRWCDRCQGLFFGGGWSTSRCPSGGTHDDPAVSGSGNYSLLHQPA